MSRSEFSVFWRGVTRPPRRLWIKISETGYGFYARANKFASRSADEIPAMRAGVSSARSDGSARISEPNARVVRCSQ